jgi:uncharacterized protein YneF (UPF0154 family)
MRQHLLVLLLVVVFILAGCKAMDTFFGYDHDTGRISENAPVGMVEDAAPIVDGLTGGPWGEIAIVGLSALSGLYIAVRKIQRRLKRNKVA